MKFTCKDFLPPFVGSLVGGTMEHTGTPPLPSQSRTQTYSLFENTPCGRGDFPTHLWIYNPSFLGTDFAWSEATFQSLKWYKHCQRHNGPEGWVHITSSTQILVEFHLQNLDQALTSKSQPNISISSQTNCREISDGVSESVSDKGSQCRQLYQLFFPT